MKIPRPALVILARLRTRARVSELGLVLLAIVVGALAGLAVSAMTLIANTAHMVIYGIPFDVRLSAAERVPPIAAFAAPMLAGLALGALDAWRARTKAPAAVDPVEANALRGGRMSLRDSVLVSAQTVVSNGCGASVGLEAGYAQIGGGLASRLGIDSRLRRQDLRMLVGCGAGGAIAAAFDAPLTGSFYAFELIIGAYSLAIAGPVFAASLVAALDHQGDRRRALRDQRPRRAAPRLPALRRPDRPRPRRGGARRRGDAGGGSDRARVPFGRPVAPLPAGRRRGPARPDGALHAADPRRRPWRARARLLRADERAARSPC